MGGAEYVMDITKPFKLNVHFLDEEKKGSSVGHLNAGW